MKKITIIIIDILIIIFTFMFIKDIYIQLKDYVSQKNIVDELDISNSNTRLDEDSTSDKKENNESEIKNELTDKYDKLKEENSDYRFWIDIENTNINYPVVQGSDNEFYLNKDFKKNKNIFGSIFEDAKTDFDKDFNTLIYGHNTKLYNMLTNITKYKEKEFFNKNNKIKIVDRDTEYMFEVFSVYTMRGFDDPTYLYDLNNKENRSDILKNIQDKSFYKVNSDKNIEKMITLITCSYEEENTRTVVHGKLISD